MITAHVDTHLGTVYDKEARGYVGGSGGSLGSVDDGGHTANKLSSNS